MTGLGSAHPYPGKLIVVEGIDGSGKSTQAQLLFKWLQSRGVPVLFTEWNSSTLVKSATRMGKRKNLLTPMTFSLLHATDFADRYVYDILPPVKSGMVMIADRYAFTAFARDTARGVDPKWVRSVYDFAVKPDIAFYFKVPVTVSLERLRSSRAKIKYYEAGLDTGLSKDAEECFLLFQQRVLNHYDDMCEEFGFEVIDAKDPIPVQQRRIRRLVQQKMCEYLRGYPPVTENSGVPDEVSTPTRGKRKV